MSTANAPSSETEPGLKVSAAPDRPGRRYWLIPAGVALIGSTPRLWQLIIPAPAGGAYIGAPYLPMDFLQYEALIREAVNSSSLLLSNPFTTDPQSPRLILLFLWALGRLSALTHLSPAVMLDVSRVVMAFLFFAVWWWFSRPLLPDRRDRTWSAVLLGFAGGFETWLHALLPTLSARTENASRFAQDTWMAYGWNFLSSSFNPLWLAGLTLALIPLRYLLEPTPLTSRKSQLIVALGVFLLYWTHPFSALAVLAITGMRPVVELLAGKRPDLRSQIRVAITLSIPLAAIGTIVLWQMSDPVYRSYSGGVLGARDASVFWYPITLGALGWLAFRGVLMWCREENPNRLSVFAWLATVVFLHSSPILNGFHFVYLLPLPVCILAARPVRQIFESTNDRSRRLVSIGLALALFLTPILVTFDAIKSADESITSADTMRLVETLSKLPGANTFVPPPIGNVIPARSAHHVWAGHWFLTPNYSRRVAEYNSLVTDPSRFDDLAKLLEENRIRYAAFPSGAGEVIRQRLGDHVKASLPHGRWLLLILQ